MLNRSLDKFFGRREGTLEEKVVDRSLPNLIPTYPQNLQGENYPAPTKPAEPKQDFLLAETDACVKAYETYRASADEQSITDAESARNALAREVEMLNELEECADKFKKAGREVPENLKTACEKSDVKAKYFFDIISKENKAGTLVKATEDLSREYATYVSSSKGYQITDTSSARDALARDQEMFTKISGLVGKLRQTGGNVPEKLERILKESEQRTRESFSRYSQYLDRNEIERERSGEGKDVITTKDNIGAQEPQSYAERLEAIYRQIDNLIPITLKEGDVEKIKEICHKYIPSAKEREKHIRELKKDEDADTINRFENFVMEEKSDEDSARRKFEELVEKEIFPFFEFGVSGVWRYLEEKGYFDKIPKEAIHGVRDQIEKLAGIEKIPIQKRETKYDERFHSSVLTHNEHGAVEGYIWEESSQGYKIQGSDRVLRKATVVVTV